MIFTTLEIVLMLFFSTIVALLYWKETHYIQNFWKSIVKNVDQKFESLIPKPLEVAPPPLIIPTALQPMDRADMIIAAVKVQLFNEFGYHPESLERLELQDFSSGLSINENETHLSAVIPMIKPTFQPTTTILLTPTPSQTKTNISKTTELDTPYLNNKVTKEELDVFIPIRSRHKPSQVPEISLH